MTTLILSEGLFDDLEGDYKFNYDPIAVALVRAEGNGNVPMNVMDQDKTLGKTIMAGDYLQRATEIRDYYKRKLFFGAMNNGFSKTRFRSQLQQCLERDDIYTLRHDEIGMFARLPDFYEEDVAREQISSVCITDKPKQSVSQDDQVVTVKYITKTMRRFGSKKTYTYWFYKPTDHRAYCFEVEGENPLYALWEDYLEPGKVIQLSGYWKLRLQDNFHFYQCPAKVIV